MAIQMEQRVVIGWRSKITGEEGYGDELPLSVALAHVDYIRVKYPDMEYRLVSPAEVDLCQPAT